jgi:hypothetical protein
VLFLFNRLTVVGNGRRFEEQTWFNLTAFLNFMRLLFTCLLLSRSAFWLAEDTGERSICVGDRLVLVDALKIQ